LDLSLTALSIVQTGNNEARSFTQGQRKWRNTMDLHSYDFRPMIDNDFGAVIFSFMMFSNDLERLAYLRELHSGSWTGSNGYFLKLIGNYTLMMMASHSSECISNIAKVKGQQSIVEFINERAELKTLFEQVLEFNFVATQKNDWTHKQKFSNAIVQLRNNVGFHYAESVKTSQACLKRFAEHGLNIGTSYMGTISTNEPTFHKLADDLMNEYFETLMFPLYTNPETRNDQIKEDMESMISAARFFCHEFIIEYLKTLPAYAVLAADGTPP